MYGNGRQGRQLTPLRSVLKWCRVWNHPKKMKIDEKSKKKMRKCQFFTIFSSLRSKTSSNQDKKDNNYEIFINFNKISINLSWIDVGLEIDSDAPGTNPPLHLCSHMVLTLQASISSSQSEIVKMTHRLSHRSFQDRLWPLADLSDPSRIQHLFVPAVRL